MKDKTLSERTIIQLIDKNFYPDAFRVMADIENNRASERTLLSCGFTRFDAERAAMVIQNIFKE